MHKTTRQIWASTSSQCFFCDFQFLFSYSVSLRTNFSRTTGTRTHARTRGYRLVNTRLTTRTQLQHQSKLQQRLATCLRVFGIDARQHSPQQLAMLHQSCLSSSPKSPASICTTEVLATSRRHLRNDIFSSDYTSSPTVARALSPDDGHLQSNYLFGPELLHPSSTTFRISSISGISIRNPRFLSTSTSTSITFDPEADPSSSLFSPVSSTPTPQSSAISKSPSQLVFTTDNASSLTADFQSLFPDISASVAEVSSRDPAASPTDAPWRNGSMSTGPQSVEILRKSVYQRDPLSTWWPLYEEVAGHWRKGSQSRAVPDQGISLVRTDFMRFIGALKVSASLTPASGHLEKLELIFEDFHMAINTPKSNVRVYSAFLTTLCFWKMRELLPDWIQRIKSKIVTSGSRFPQEDLPSIRESVQEQYYDLMRVLANMNQIEAMTDCLEDLKARNMDQLRPTTKAYDMVLEANMKRKDTESAMRIFQEMQDQGFPPQLMTFNVLLQGHLENKDARAAQRVLESLLLTDIQPDIYTFNLLMSGYLNMGEIETVIGFYKGLGEYGLTPNSKTYRILMKTHLRQGQVDRVINLFCKLKESQQTELHPGPEDYRILVQALASNDRMTDALRVLRELIETAKVPVTTPIYNVFLNQYAREGQVGKARRILDRIISEKLPVIDGCINPLIRAYLTQGDLDKVEEMANLMSRHGVQLSRTTYNIMINATKNSGDLSGTWKMYKSMLEDGVKPDVWTYNTLLDILISKLSPTQDNTNRKRDLNAATEEQIEEYMPQIETLLQEMKSRGIRPDVVTYGKLIHQYVILRDMEHAETMFHDMLKSGITPNGFVFNTLMNGFTMFDDMEKALELFRRMPKYGVGPDATTFTTLIKGYANTKQFTLARDFANSLQQRTPKISLDQYCFHTLIQLAQKSHRPGMALDFFEMMRGRGMEPDKVTFTILIEALSREFAQTVSPSSKTKSGIWGRDRRTTTGNRQAESTAEAVESLLGVIQQDKFPLKPSEVTTVISAYFRLGRPLAAIEFFKTSFWQGNPKLNTTNCGAMFNGLLAQEYRGRYDGIVLNLYSLMLTSTKEIIRAEEEDRRRSLASVNEEPQSHKSPGAGDSQEMKDCRTSWSSSLPMSSSSSRNAMLKRSETKSSYVLSSDLPALDLILINILFQAFYKRNNWKIVLQLWQDLESVGAEKLYPFEMPLEFLGWAAQAYHMTSRRESSTSPSRTEVEDPGNDSYSQHQQEEAKSRAEMAKKLLRRLWGSHPRMGATWSTKIYGYNMFKTYTPSNSSSSPPPSLKTTATSRASPHPSSLLLSYLSDHTDERNHRHVDRDMNESKDDKEDERS